MFWVWPEVKVGVINSQCKTGGKVDCLLCNTPANPGEAGDEVDAIALLQLHQPLHGGASIRSQLLFL